MDITEQPAMQASSFSQLHPSQSSIRQRLQQKSAQLMLKRAFDILTSLGLVVLISPLLLLVTLLIKLSSKGAVLYSNERVGLHGEHFRCYKFRSMVSNQSLKHAVHAKALKQSEQGVLLKLSKDPRVTWIGRIIRKTSIDELPQLFNVLRGDMSMIGPRPLVPFMLSHHPEFTRIRCMVRPGITGLWQVRDRKNNTSAEFMIKHDMEYVTNFSLLLDLKIMLLTPFVVLSAEGAV